jgi:ribosomal protein S12 methylthiotransferase
MSGKQHCSSSLRKPRVAIHTLGCPKNTVDSDTFGRILLSAGFELTERQSAADVLIVNTCGFLDDAKLESIQTLLEAGRWKSKKAGRKVLAMGCLTQRDGKEITAEMPELDGVFGIGEWSRMLETLGESPLSRTDSAADSLDCAGKATPGSAYLRISDGCSHACAFCSIPQMRGLYRSEPLEHLLGQAQRLAAQGVKELILIGQECTSYGVDLYRKRGIIELCNRLSDLTGIEWIRILYAHPPSCPPQLMRELARVPKLAPYIDFPIEHAADSVLKRMNRRTTAARMREAIEAFRAELPEACVRTTILVGFPGETEAEFAELYRFMEEVRFERAGVFTYSPQEGTAGAALLGRVEEGIALDRLDSLMKLQRRIMTEKHAALLGRHLKILVEKTTRTSAWGRSAWDAPEIDARVKLHAPATPGAFVRARIERTSAYTLEARALDDTAFSNTGPTCEFTELPLLS